jgi:hypothetical protein
VSEFRRGLFWGCQGTVDYRVPLDEIGFAALGFEAPAEDLELFVTGSEFRELLEQARAVAAAPVAEAPGGSPLVSALASRRWLSRREEVSANAWFVGAFPATLTPLLDDQGREAVRFAFANPAICGTLALEYQPASAKLMLAVPDGRWLGEELAQVSLQAFRDCLVETRPGRVGFGVGGLNKADPEVVVDLVAQARAAAPDCLVFATTSSFAKELVAGRPASYWQGLRAVLAAADVISMSAEEEGQLAQVWDAGWVEELLARGPKLAVVHSAHGISVRPSSRLAPFLTDPAAAVEAAHAEATRYAARALTGLGARFDGVLSAAVLTAWRPCSA